jgi:hypothetical protein
MHVSEAKNILTARVDLPVSVRSRVNKIRERTLQAKLADKVADMHDHDRRLFHAHMLSSVLMNTRRHTRGVRGRVKTLMMISVKL